MATQLMQSLTTLPAQPFQHSDILFKMHEDIHLMAWGLHDSLVTLSGFSSALVPCVYHTSQEVAVPGQPGS